MGGLIENILSIFTGPDTQRNYTLMGATQADVERIEAEDATEKCKVCGGTVKTMCFQGMGVCGENHRKVIAKAEEAIRTEQIERAEASLIP